MKQPQRTFKTLTPEETAELYEKTRTLRDAKAAYTPTVPVKRMLKREDFRQTDAEIDAERKRKDNQEYNDRLARLATAKKAENKNVIGDKNWRQNLADKTAATGDKLRFSNRPNFFDDYINPASWVGDMASKIGQAPKEAKESNSVMPYVTSIGTPIATGALAGIGAKAGTSRLKGLARQSNELFNPLAGVSKSSLDWGKWNKEIPLNKPLMKEYGKIEKTSKAKGTWMKNPDGSKFEGTPEQFVQQNSENFKKAFGNSKLVNPDGSPTIQYHGSAKKFDTFDESKFQLGDSGYSGKGIYTTPNKSAANSYALSSAKFHKGDINPTVYELYGQANNPISSSELIKNKKDYDLFNFHREKDWKGHVPIENQMRNYDAAIADQLPNIERVRPWHDAREIVFPTNKQLKSAAGNNGMFDMTNPNIYKAVVPAAVAGKLGYDKNKKDKPKS